MPVTMTKGQATNNDVPLVYGYRSVLLCYSSRDDEWVRNDGSVDAHWFYLFSVSPRNGTRSKSPRRSSSATVVSWGGGGQHKKTKQIVACQIRLAGFAYGNSPCQEPPFKQWYVRMCLSPWNKWMMFLVGVVVLFVANHFRLAAQ